MSKSCAVSWMLSHKPPRFKFCIIMFSLIKLYLNLKWKSKPNLALHYSMCCLADLWCEARTRSETSHRRIRESIYYRDGFRPPKCRFVCVSSSSLARSCLSVSWCVSSYLRGCRGPCCRASHLLPLPPALCHKCIDFHVRLITAHNLFIPAPAESSSCPCTGF